MEIIDIDIVDDYEPHQCMYYVEDVLVSNKPVYLFVKRFLDISLCVLALIVLFPLMLILAIFIKLDSEGPAIFSQERLGLNGKPFKIYKFRTMRLDAEDDGPKWALNDDERCTKLGRILRKCRLDELPQLWNIIRGDMSIVGPRPERAFFYEQFEKYIVGFSKRLKVKPGLTGYAQINGGYDLRPEEKIVYDMKYIENRSLKMDIWCILCTIRLVFTHEGAR